MPSSSLQVPTDCDRTDDGDASGAPDSAWLWPIAAGCACFVIVMFVALQFDAAAIANHSSNTREAVVRELARIRSASETLINRRLHLLLGLKAHVSVHPDIDSQEFADLAGNLQLESDGIRSITLIKDNVISDVYPMAGNEGALGMKLLEHPAQRAAAQHAIKTGKPWLDGPIKLVQGGEAFVYRAPVRTTPRAAAPASGKYWGMVSMLIDRNALVRAIEEAVPADVTIAIRGNSTDARQGQLFVGDESILAAEPLVTSISLPTGTWQLYGVRKGGWPAQDADAASRRIFSFVLAAMIGCLVFLAVRSMIRLRHAAVELAISGAAAQRAQQDAEQSRDFADRKAQTAQRFAAQLTTARDALQVSNGELQQFAYIVSHDLKAPLRSVTNMVDCLLEDCSANLDEQGHEYLCHMTAAVVRMRGLIDGVLEYSRAGRLVDELTTIATHQLVQETIADLDPDATCEVHIEGELPDVVFSPMRLRQVFQNLIGNAMQHGCAGKGRVVISSTPQDDRHEFSVRDNGVGINSRFHAQIFELFGSLQRSDNPDSSGVGLAIVKKSVESFGGSIRVISSEGEGSDFRFSILHEPWCVLHDDDEALPDGIGESLPEPLRESVCSDHG